MGSFGSIGHVEALFTADTTGVDAGLQSLGEKSEAAGKKMEMAAQFAKLMGDAVDQAGQKSERAATIQERAAERARRAWQQELIQQDRATEAEQRSARAKELAALKADILARSLEKEKHAQDDVNSSVEHSVPQFAAASGVIRAMEGGMTNNVRAAERFLTTTLKLGPMLQTLFPLAGGLAFLDIIANMTEKVAELANNWMGVRDAENAAMDALVKSGEAGEENANEHARMLRQQQVTDAQMKVPREQREAAGAAAAVRFDLAMAQTKLADLKDEIANAEQSIKRENLVQRTTARDSATFPSQIPGGSPRTIDAGPTPDAKIAAARLMEQNAKLDTLRGQVKNTQAQILLLSSEYELRRKEIAEGGTRAERKNATEQMEAWAQQLAAQKADHTMTLDDEAEYWQKKADSVKKGSILYNRALAKANADRAESHKQYMQSFVGETIDRIRDSEQEQASSDRVTSAITEQWDKAQRNELETKRINDEAAVRAFEETNHARQASDQLAEEAIRYQQQIGRMSPADAAEALRAVHEQSFADWAQKSAEFSAAHPDLAVPGAINVLHQRDRDQMEDAERERSLTLLGAFGDGLSRTTQRLEEWQQKGIQLFDETLGSVNDEIVHALTTRDHQKAFEFGNIGANLGRGIMGIGLEKMEGDVLKALGFGGGKPDGSASKPFHVVMGAVSAAGSAVSNDIGGLFGKILHVFHIPGFAEGGSIPSNMPAIVGERGPELFIPSTAGHIVPNHRLLGGGHTFNIPVDARGATDPAQVKAAARSAVREAIPAILQASLAASREERVRTPSMKR